LAAAVSCTPDFEVHEATIAEIHSAMQSGQITAEGLVQSYLDRIEAYDKQGPTLNALITLNPNALERARELDQALVAEGLVGPLHGIPVIVKDNYDTHDLPTTNGTLAFKGAIPPDDAYQVRRLRDAGAIVLAKANLAEFAFSGAYSVSSILPGYSRNPYDPRRVTAGSSGGTAAAVAANLGTVGVGTDTGSSIRGPASHQALVGFRTTMGLTSRDGIAPLNSTRDIGGPMARTVTDAVRVLDVIVGHDLADSVTAAGVEHTPETYLAFLDSAGLQQARIGVLRQFFEVEDSFPDELGVAVVDPDEAPDAAEAQESPAEPGAQDPPEPRTIHPEILGLMNQAVADMAAAGAVVIDSLEIGDLEEIRDISDGVSRMRYDFEAYLATRPEIAMKTLEEIVETGDFHPNLRAGLGRAVEAEGAPEDDPDYEANLEEARRLREAVLGLMDEHQLDALVYPTYNYPPRFIGDLNSPYGANSGTLSPPTGFPAFNVPMGYSLDGLPAGLQLLGRPFGEPPLIRISFAYEQATMHRRPPPLAPPLP